MKGKVPSFKDRIEVIELLKELRHVDARLSGAIASLVRDLKRDYWGVDTRKRIVDIIYEHGKEPEKFPRLRGYK